MTKLVAAALVSAATTLLQAQSLSVGNSSFESPAVPPGFPAITTISSWQKAPVPAGFPADQWDNLAGIFPNAPIGDARHITNADGNQVAFLFAVQGASISQQLTSDFAVGIGYNLTVGLRGGGALTPGTTFQVGLYYMDGTAHVPVAAHIVSATADYATTTQLFSISANVPAVKAGDAWAGKAIGIEFAATSNNGAPGIAYWELDKVSVTAVPEPGTNTLLACGSLGMFALAAWRRLQGKR